MAKIVTIHLLDEKQEMRMATYSLPMYDVVYVYFYIKMNFYEVDNVTNIYMYL